MEKFDLMVAQNIFDLLEKQNKKQSDLEKYLQMPRQTIGKILSGQRNLTANELSRIANFFGCEIKDLTKQTNISNEKIYAYFMGEGLNEEIKEVINNLFELSDIIIEQQYINDCKKV